MGLGIPLNIQNIQTPPPTSSDSLFPFPSNPCTHTHLIVIDSVFVPLCGAVASDEDTYTEPRHCTHCTLCRNYRSATSCTVRAFRLGVCKQLCAWKVIAKWDRAECVGRMARLLRPYCRPHPLWTRTRGSRPDRLRGPAGEGGSGLRNVSEVVNSFHPSSGMGTRSHSLTRHKAGCVCERVGGSREGF